jgi:hypothetical protein
MQQAQQDAAVNPFNKLDVTNGSHGTELNRKVPRMPSRLAKARGLAVVHLTQDGDRAQRGVIDTTSIPGLQADCAFGDDTGVRVDEFFISFNDELLSSFCHHEMIRVYPLSNFSIDNTGNDLERITGISHNINTHYTSTR